VFVQFNLGFTKTLKLMARGKSYIQIEGLFDTEVLGAFMIIRGFASLQDLADISVPVLMEVPDASGSVRGTQRELDEQHAEEIKRYFEEGDRRFIPEIILSVRASLTAETDGLHQIGVRYDDGNLAIYRKHQSKNIRIHKLSVNRKNIEQVKREQRIRRIDGNHRLAKAAELAPVPGQENRYKVPFCLLLLGEPNNEADNYTEALIFHTINSTAKPLDGERALQLILGQNPAYTMPPQAELEYSPALHLTRLLDEKVRNLPSPQRDLLGGRSLARLSVASKEMLRSYPDRFSSLLKAEGFADEISALLSEVGIRLSDEFPALCSANYFFELAAHVWMRTEAVVQRSERIRHCCNDLRNLALWLGTKGLQTLTQESPIGSQIIEIYEGVRQRVPKKVFLARWYPGIADGLQKTRAENRLMALQRLVVDELGLEMVDMGTEERGTDLIHPRLYEAISSSDIIIVDLTGLRPNVMIELGYSLNHQGSGRLLLLFDPTDAHMTVPFDTNSFRYETINEAADIPAKLRGHIQGILQEAIVGTI
jgi:hypothetical protein